jgi:hypothetical protein
MGITTGEIVAYSKAKQSGEKSNYVENYNNFFTDEEFNKGSNAQSACNDATDEASYKACVDAFEKANKQKRDWLGGLTNLLSEANDTLATIKGDGKASSSGDYYAPTPPKKGLSGGAVVGIFLGAAALGFGIYYIAKKK